MITNDQLNERELTVLLRELRAVLHKDIPGDIVELGCYKGKTSLAIQRLIQTQQSEKQLYVYDSFAGLPPKVGKDNSPAGDQFMQGELSASKKDVIRLFKQSGLPMPIVKKAWFNELVSTDLPDVVAFAFLDGDFYESILDSLKIVWSKLAAGAIIVVDDYQNESLPGAQRAVDEWLGLHPAKLRVESSLAIIQLDRH